jgi:transposase
MERIIDQFRLPDQVWQRLEPLLPKHRRSKKGGRPPLPLRQMADGVFYVLRTGCQWKAAPAEFGSGSSLHRYFQEWVRRGVFRKLWRLGLLEYDRHKHIQWDWQTIDGAMTKAPLGGEKNREKPDRSREVGNETFPPHRWQRHTVGTGRQRGQYA